MDIHIDKERISAYAEERFMREGFARITVDDLAAGMGMSKRTFYRAYRCKEELIDHIVSTMLGGIRMRIEAITHGKASFVEKIYAMMEVFALVYRRVESPMTADLQRHLPAVWMKIETFRREGIEENFTWLLVQGIREGTVLPGTNVRLLTLSLVGAVQNVVRPTVLADESFSAREAVEGIIRMVLLGVTTEKGRKDLQRIGENHIHG